ncbi:hypothetical protein EXU29_09465 [Acinetobacter wuhouensis]|uniref:PAAR domain-containing protein n=1 Tax=Acinetobacter wuhouensis TaxID=1879050 RepID=UPI001023C5CB|nr:PAAR domain-containing protein [Acinetobacter wuhouensis]RZG72719.1 hypothetical protein EXU29_09465 [Acinetobacter wuhouensis]
MTDLTFLHQKPIEQIKKMSQEDIEQTIKAEQLYLDNKPQTIYPLAVNGAKSKNGGLVKASTDKVKFDGLAVARAGDNVIYADGTTSKIISGSGKACLVEGISVALVGSRLENGDEIIESPNKAVGIRLFKYEPLPEGFLDHE